MNERCDSVEFQTKPTSATRVGSVTELKRSAGPLAGVSSPVNAGADWKLFPKKKRPFTRLFALIWWSIFVENVFMLATFAELTVITPDGSVGKYFSRFSPIGLVVKPAAAIRERAALISDGIGIACWYGDVT